MAGVEQLKRVFGRKKEVLLRTVNFSLGGLDPQMLRDLQLPVARYSFNVLDKATLHPCQIEINVNEPDGIKVRYLSIGIRVFPKDLKTDGYLSTSADIVDKVRRNSSNNDGVVWKFEADARGARGEITLPTGFFVSNTGIANLLKELQENFAGFSGFVGHFSGIPQEVVQSTQFPDGVILIYQR